jgi:tripeptidyl-peptidase-1
MYNVGDYVPKPAAGSRIGFGSFLNESAQQSDLEAYQTLFDIPTQRFTVELINGGVDDQNAPSSDIGEANLDVQLISAVSHPLPIHEFITGGVAYANLHATFFLLTCTDLLQSIHSRCR